MQLDEYMLNNFLVEYNTGTKMGLSEFAASPLFIYGSGGRTRTGMFLRSADFESAVSTISPLRHVRTL